MKAKKIMRMALAGLLALASAGCNEYRVETEVREDGSGTRKMTFMMDPDQEELGERTPEMYARMFGVGPGSAWEVQSVGDNAEYSDREGKRVFTLESSVNGADDWSRLDGSITIKGTLDNSDYSGIFFANAVSLERGSAPSGRSITYRESFRWNGLIEAVVDFQAGAYACRMKKDFPHLGNEAIAELRGMMAGHLLVGIRLLDIWNDNDEELAQVALSVGRAAEEIVASAGRKVDLEHVYDVARVYVADEDSELEAFLEKNLPGVVYAGLTEVKMNLLLPGKVVETNGRILEDGSVEWKMNLLDALGGNVEFHARSETR